MALTEHPKYVTTAGFGCIYINYGEGPESQQEPTIITKFFGSNDRAEVDKSISYNEEKVSHAQIIRRCGNFPTMSSIFGIDLNSGGVTLVRGYNDDINVMGPDGIVTIRKQPLYSDVSPAQICELPNYKGAKLNNPVHKINERYPVIKMNYLGNELFKKEYVNLRSFIQSLELLALFHTGMIHNDMKGNNMLISPLTGRVSLIDFGLCKPYDIKSNTPPYVERSAPALGQSWYAYPPEYTFLKPGGKEYQRNRRVLETYYLPHYDEMKTNYHWPNNPVLNRQAREAPDARVTRISAILEKVHDEYLSDLTKMPKIFLETAITGDTYTLGLEKEFIYGSGDRTPIDIGTSTITGDDFLNRISILITALHPKYRPYHINILKLFKHYNKGIFHGAITFIKVEDDEEPYTELSILNGVPANIKVASGMALGKAGCPITSDDVYENLILLYFLLQKNTDEINRHINDLSRNHASLLAEAKTFITENPTTLFPLPSPVNAPATPAAHVNAPDAPAAPAALSVPVNAPSAKPAGILFSPKGTSKLPPRVPYRDAEAVIGLLRDKARLPPRHPDPRAAENVTALLVPPPRPEVAKPVRPFVQVRPLGPSVKASTVDVNASAKLVVDHPGPERYAGPTIPAKPPIYHPAPEAYINVSVLTFLEDVNKRGGKRNTQKQRGGTNGKRIIPITNITTNLIHACILSIGVYIAALERSSKESIEEILMNKITKKIGGRGVTISNNIGLLKINKTLKNKFKKLNHVRTYSRITSRGTSNIEMSNYSDLQKLSFFNEIVTSDHIGKINLLHAHYLKYLSHEDQKEIIRLLLFTPMADSNIVQIILDHLSDGTTKELMIYLTALIKNHIYSVEKQLPLNINKATEKLSIIIEEYITSNNYMMFFHTIGKFIL